MDRSKEIGTKAAQTLLEYRVRKAMGRHQGLRSPVDVMHEEISKLSPGMEHGEVRTRAKKAIDSARGYLLKGIALLPSEDCFLEKMIDRLRREND
jgi:hypothetical protein